jgi:hypothetical protein
MARFNFFLKQTMQENPCGKCCVGTVIYKRDAEINNVIYMELYSGPKMAHDKYGKTNVAGSIDRDSTVIHLMYSDYFYIYAVFDLVMDLWEN